MTSIVASPFIACIIIVLCHIEPPFCKDLMLAKDPRSTNSGGKRRTKPLMSRFFSIASRSRCTASVQSRLGVSGISLMGSRINFFSNVVPQERIEQSLGTEIPAFSMESSTALSTSDPDWLMRAVGCAGLLRMVWVN